MRTYLIHIVSLADAALDNTAIFEVNHDLTSMVLEIASEGSKAMKDSEPTSLRALLFEFEESEIIDTTLCMHDLTRRSVAEGLC